MDSNASRTKLPGRAPIPGSSRGLKGFLTEARIEMTKVTWPTPRETTRLTGVVLAVCGLVVALLFVISLVLDQAINFLIKGAH